MYVWKYNESFDCTHPKWRDQLALNLTPGGDNNGRLKMLNKHTIQILPKVVQIWVIIDFKVLNIYVSLVSVASTDIVSGQWVSDLTWQELLYYYDSQ